jgi:hypothetical protein
MWKSPTPEMPLSWVAPTIAAEIWGISIEQVLAAVANGSIPSRMDGQFLFVNIDQSQAPAMPSIPRQTDPALQAVPSDDRASETVVTPQEMAALGVGASITDDSSQEALPPDISDWRNVRSRTSRLRRPPTARI